MPERYAHLVGSLPGADAREAMSVAMEVLGPHLRSLPDGETGDRRNWIISIVESLRDHPDLELVKDGDWSDYDKTPKLRVRRGHRLYGANLDFGHVAAADAALPVLEELRRDHARPDLVFQAGVPGDLDLAMFTLGPEGALRHRRAFTEATLAEIRGVQAITGPATLFQIEVPAELVLLAKVPRAALATAARRLAGPITNLAQAAPVGTHFAVHLCLGDMNNRAYGRMRDVSPLVELANAVVRSWPSDRALDLIHAPFAAADQPATTDPAFFAPLAGLSLPSGTRFAAGFAHEAQSLADQRVVQNLIETPLGRPVDVAAACGLGRRSAADGRRVLERTVELLAD